MFSLEHWKSLIELISHHCLIVLVGGRDDKFIDDLYHASGKDIFDTVMICATKKKVLVVSHEPLLSMSIENFFRGSNNKNFLNAIEKFNTSAFFNVSFECKNWYEIQGKRKNSSRIN